MVQQISQAPIVCVMGPTAAGKTALALDLAEVLDAEIISVDSALVYQDMHLGTAKPTSDELARARHHLIDWIPPDRAFNAADFARAARDAIAEIEQRGKRVIMVGGTMLYFKALLEGLAPMPPADLGVRARIEALGAVHGWPYVHSVLAKADPLLAADIHPNHSQRLGRALEIYWSSGKVMSEWQKGQPRGLLLERDCVQLAVAPHDRACLHARIASRFHGMLKAGFVDEVRQLMARGDLTPAMPSMRSVGYRQAWMYLAGEMDYDSFVEQAIAATRQLAKRQLTWLRGWPDIVWLDTQSPSGETCTANEILAKALKVLAPEVI